MAGSPPNFHKMDYRSACTQGVLEVEVKVKGHVIRALSWILGMSYSVIDVLVMTSHFYQRCSKWWYSHGRHVRPSVCLSVTLWCCIGMNKAAIKITSPTDKSVRSLNYGSRQTMADMDSNNRARTKCILADLSALLSFLLLYNVFSAAVAGI